MMEEPAMMEGAPPPEESSNRTFIVLALLLGGAFIVGLIFLGLYAFVIGPRQKETRQAQAATVAAQNTQIALNGLMSSTPNTPTPDASATALSLAQTAAANITPTPVVRASATPTVTAGTPGATLDPAALTAAAPLGAGTQTAGGGSATPKAGASKSPTPLVGGLTGGTPTPSSQLPGTGFADEAGVPTLIIATLALIAVVILARRARLSLR
jgi:hypothetical protein